MERGHGTPPSPSSASAEAAARDELRPVPLVLAQRGTRCSVRKCRSARPPPRRRSRRPGTAPRRRLAPEGRVRPVISFGCRRGGAALAAAPPRGLGVSGSSVAGASKSDGAAPTRVAAVAAGRRLSAALPQGKRYCCAAHRFMLLNVLLFAARWRKCTRRIRADRYALYSKLRDASALRGAALVGLCR